MDLKEVDLDLKEVNVDLKEVDVDLKEVVVELNKEIAILSAPVTLVNPSKLTVLILKVSEFEFLNGCFVLIKWPLIYCNIIIC